jgi:type II secretory pathway pseudopilin PulG
MKPVKINGFTIVETMLFLGISGLLIMSVLVGTGASINIQRYRDSVTSLQSFLQLQYSNVANVSNDTTEKTCGESDSTPRGQSSCVILGKYITVNGTTIQTSDVIGTDRPNSEDASDDLSALKSSLIKVSTFSSPETYELEWGSSIGYKSGDSAPYILILRSPSSGVIRTFISKTTPTDGNISEILDDSQALIQPAQLCVNSNGLFTGNTMAVKIDGNSTSASGVELLGDNSGC